MKQFSHIQYHIFLSLVFMVGFLWHLLAPGYVILLDWTAGPEPLFSYNNVDHMINAPLNGLLYLLGSVLPGWVVQKGTLILLGFALLFVPLRISFFCDFFVRLFVALIVAINPFVYERLLAGQWRVVVGYLFTYALIVFLLRRIPDYRKIFGTLLLCGFFSIHFLVIGSIVILIWFLVKLFVGHALISRTGFVLGFLRTAVLFILLSLYWIVPFITSQLSADAPLSPAVSFGPEHWEAFATVGEQRWGAVVNVFFMHGFWLEGRAWAEDFSIASQAPLFVYGLLALYGLAALGVCHFFWRKSSEKTPCLWRRFGAWFLTVLFLVSFCFSLGLGTSPFYGINLWLFEHVSLWSGFRDSQKWSGVMILVLALVAAWGVQCVYRFLHDTTRVLGWVFGMACLLLPFMITPSMMLGFASQTQVSWYPQSWENARSILLERAEESPCTIVSLPWHQYYRLDHNGESLSANVSRRFFPCVVVSSLNTALGDVGTEVSRIDDAYTVIDTIVTSNDDRDEVMTAAADGLRAAGVTHIVLTDDLFGQDLYRYPFLEEKSLTKIFDEDGVLIFAL